MADLICEVTLAPELTVEIELNGTGATGTSTDELVKYDAADPAADYLGVKIVAGTGITIAEGVGANENKVQVTNSDTGSGAVAAHNIAFTHANIHASGSDAETITTIGTILNSANADIPLDADTFTFWDAVDAVLKKVTWLNIKNVFALAGHNHTGTYQPVGSYEVTTNKETVSLDTSITKYPNNAVVNAAVNLKADKSFVIAMSIAL